MLNPTNVVDMAKQTATAHQPCDGLNGFHADTLPLPPELLFVRDLDWFSTIMKFNLYGKVLAGYECLEIMRYV